MITKDRARFIVAVRRREIDSRAELYVLSVYIPSMKKIKNQKGKTKLKSLKCACRNSANS
jgi:hypothetical protein